MFALIEIDLDKDWLCQVVNYTLLAKFNPFSSLCSKTISKKFEWGKKFFGSQNKLLGADVPSAPKMHFSEDFDSLW